MAVVAGGSATMALSCAFPSTRHLTSILCRPRNMIALRCFASRRLFSSSSLRISTIPHASNKASRPKLPSGAQVLEDLGRPNSRTFEEFESDASSLHQDMPETHEVTKMDVSATRLPISNIDSGTEFNNLNLQPLSDQIYKFFAERGISKETLKRNSVLQTHRAGEDVIAFTYCKNSKIVGCKYRTLSKFFWQEKVVEKIPYGMDDILNAEDIIIVEGEIDKLSMEEAGFKNCISVPDGAPSQLSKKKLPNPNEDKRFSYLWTYKEVFEKASRIILATDADNPGQILAEEIARRVGREKCWRVTWPIKGDTEVCKDANEVLMRFGGTALKNMIDKAELYPIRGLFKFSDYFSEIDAYYNNRIGSDFGVSTGWCGLDGLYRIVPGELSIVTGVPNSGKSEWIDALLCNLNQNKGWRFALCSMENKVREHARKLLEKHVKKPFFDAGYRQSIPKMSSTELEEGKKWLNDSFYLIRCEDDALPSIDWVLQLAKSAILRHGVRGLVIDPYNELDHQRHDNQTETEYVSQMLTKVKRFAQFHDCHVWFVAHPRQLQNWNGAAPSLYDISGSAHFINKCDNGIVVHRNRDESAGPLDQVQIHVRKVRNKVAGTIGQADLRYNREIGTYEDIVG